jgi:hypothetical protein
MEEFGSGSVRIITDLDPGVLKCYVPGSGFEKLKVTN